MKIVTGHGDSVEVDIESDRVYLATSNSEMEKSIFDVSSTIALNAAHVRVVITMLEQALKELEQ